MPSKKNTVSPQTNNVINEILVDRTQYIIMQKKLEDLLS